MAVSWHAFDLRTGRRGPRVQTVKLGTVKEILGEVTDTTLEVFCWDEATQRPWPDWDAATLPGRTMLVALDDDETILWGGMVLRRISGPDATVTVSVATVNAFWDRRFVGDHAFSGTDQASIVTTLLSALDYKPPFVVDAPASGVLRDRIYLDDEDKTLLSILDELSGVENGPEIHTQLQWANTAKTLIQPVVHVRPRIGASQVHPTQWTMPGCVTDFELIEDYTAEQGANDVMATSSGQGDTRPESRHQVATDLLAAGWCRFEDRFSPSTSITEVETLNAHAREELARMRDGLTQLTLKADLAAAPRLGVDWWIGDDITAVLTCPRFPEHIGPNGNHVPGYERRLRVMGWEIDLDAGVLSPNTREVDQ